MLECSACRRINRRPPCHSIVSGQLTLILQSRRRTEQNGKRYRAESPYHDYSYDPPHAVQYADKHTSGLFICQNETYYLVRSHFVTNLE
jgi:hypothetical protein